MKEYLKNWEDVAKELGTSTNGLSSEEAKKRLEENGKNKLEEGKKTPLFIRFLNELKDPMVLVLIAAAIVSFVTAVYADESFVDVIIIITVVIVNAILGVYQESKAEKAIEALAQMAAATTKVIRDGQLVIVKSEDVVVGDVIVVEAGDDVSADARIIESASMKIEEAALTGEAVATNKTSDVLVADKDVLLGDRKNMMYMGTSVVYGRGKAIVCATGMDTEMGKIANALTQAKDEETPLQLKLNQLSKILSVLVLVICVFIFAVDVFTVYPNVTGEGLLDSFMVAVSLAVAAIPEGLAAVVTIVLSMGVTKMSKRKAIIRKLTAVETLGCTQVICSDKTGTLTQNKMTVVKHYGEEQILATALSMCSDAVLDQNKEATGEPTECALVNYAYKVGLDKGEQSKEYVRINEIPFDSIRKMMTTIHETKEGIVQFSKGAPDEIIKRCTHALVDGKVVEMSESMRAEYLKDNKSMADEALRVLAAAKKDLKENPTVMDSEVIEKDLCFIGLVGMMDPVREEVKDAIAECKEANIKAIMITGDHKDTAVAIAKQLHILEDASHAITGAELNEMSDDELIKNIDQYRVYARVQPEHKVRIVNAWKANGCVCAMSGDGVNDAPAIKNADIGVGMGITGTDVTKNVADMVLADDNFATIVSAVEEGRRIYDNIRKSIQFLLSSNLAEVLSIFTATLMGFTILKPVHLLWINLITDTFPALALGNEESEADIMQRPPRPKNEGIFANGLGVDVFIEGTIITILTLSAYFIGHFIESGRWEIVNSADGITMAFLTLSLVEMFHSFNMRSQTKSIFKLTGRNKMIWIAMLVSLVSTLSVIYVPFLSAAFDFEAISLYECSISILLAFSIIPIIEIKKWIRRSLSK